MHKPFCTQACFSCPRGTSTACAALDVFMACMPQRQEVAQDWFCFPLSLLSQMLSPAQQDWAAAQDTGVGCPVEVSPCAKLSLEAVAEHFVCAPTSPSILLLSERWKCLIWGKNAVDIKQCLFLSDFGLFFFFNHKNISISLK